MGVLAGILMITQFFVFQLGQLACLAFLAYVGIEHERYKGLLVWIGRTSIFLGMKDWEKAYNDEISPPQLIESFEYAEHHKKNRSLERYKKRSWYQPQPENEATSAINFMGYVKAGTDPDLIKVDTIKDHRSD
jgi:hypothetical protein